MLAGFLVAALIAVAAAWVVVQSGWFHEYVRQRIISELEQATGGRVELGRFSFRGSTLTARVAPLVVHGKESPGEPPLFSAEEVALGLRVLSIWERKVDLASLRVDKPRLRIVLYPDGSTNLPDPLVRDPGRWAQDLIHLAVRRYEVVEGLLEYDNRKISLNTSGERLELRMSYDTRTQAYSGELKTRGVWVLSDDYGPIQAQASAQFAIERSRVVFSHAEFSTGKSRVELSGELDDPRRPRGSFHVKANASAGELVKTFALPIETAGRAAFEGVLSVAFTDGFRFAFDGKASARGVSYATNRWKLEGMDLSANVSAGPERISFKNIQASVSPTEPRPSPTEPRPSGSGWRGTTFTGSATLEHRSKLSIEGNVNNLTVAQAAKFVTDRAIPWNGVMSGEVTVAATLGESDAKACVNFSVTPAEAYAGSNAAAQATGLTGTIHATYDQAGQDISFDPVALTNGFTRVEASGTLDKSVQMRLHSTRLEDISPALSMLDMLAPEGIHTEPRPGVLLAGRGSSPTEPRPPGSGLLALPKDLPLQLNNGVVEVSGTVTGSLDDPSFQGRASVTNGIVKGHAFEQFSSDFTATRTEVSASRFTLVRGATEVTGSGNLSGSLAGGFENGTLAAQATIRNANLQELAREAGSSLAIAGMANAAVRVSGSLRAPQAEIALDVQNPVAFGERLDRVRANLSLTADSVEGGLQPPLTKKTGFSLASVEVSNGQAEDGPGRLQFSGAYRRTGADWRTGAAQIQLAAQNLPAKQIDRLNKVAPRLNGLLNGDVRGRLQLDRGRIELTSAEGNVSAQTVTLDGQPLGEIALSGGTASSNASVAITGKLRGVAFDGQGSWKLEGDEPGSVNIRFAPLSVDLLHKLAMLSGAAPSGGGDLPFDGVVQGRAAVSIALQRPRDVQAQLTLDRVELDPKANQAKRLGVPQQDITVKSSQPVVIALTAREARIVSAKFAARDTSLEARGAVPFASGAGANITVSGSVNLIVLQLLNPNLLAKGAAEVQASLQGALTNPDLAGRLELKNASLYLTDVPNGLDNANGVVHFDRNRAVVDQLTARSGGGTIAFGGFIEFGQVLTYRLQARAQQVRVAYPQGLSNSFDADLALTGTSEASTLSGTITMDRTVIDPNIDLGPLLAASQRPAPENAAPNDYLHGMQFNIRIQGAPRYELDTALTRDVQAATDLRLRGTPSRPVLLGTIDVNQGEIALPGSRYTIDRGEISFVNQVRIEPILDMQLETKARGTNVTIGFRGPMNKLNISYSSDPPLRESEIIALLAVGRTPSATDILPSAQPINGLSGLASGDMLGQALSNQMSSRFQRFFGASGVKIDPNMTGVENLPQARLTWEEQVSKEVTFTYITNLNRTQEQIVRVEWDFDKSWSAVAVRDANGLFGIDFQYRKRFK
ncbi:MAG TPA: translocation/assembly module TamB domain-containing protein [Bryobacteraceae bacterium]